MEILEGLGLDALWVGCHRRRRQRDRQPLDQNELRLLAGGGNFGFNEEHAIASFGEGWWREELAGARDFSTGFMPDRDYRNLALSSLSQLKSRLGAGSILFAYSDRPIRREPVLWPIPVVGAHQNVVYLRAPESGR